MEPRHGGGPAIKYGAVEQTRILAEVREAMSGVKEDIEAGRGPLAGPVTAAAVILAAFPCAALWLLGLLAGFAFLSEGWALVVLGLAARKAGR